MKKILVVFFFLSAFAVLFLYYAAFVPNVISDQAVITVGRGADISSLKDSLRPYVKSVKTFELTAKLKRFSTPKPGKYRIVKDMTNNALVNLFRSGKQMEIDVTFNNIHSLEDLAGKISDYITADSTELLKAFTDKSFLEQNGFTEATAILMYIPNTYRFFYTTDAKQFRDRMLAEYKKFWNEDRRKKARAIGLTPVEVGILASIVKKETVKREEKPVVAGVYINRLKRGIKLEADPTAVYAYKLLTGDTATIRRVLNKHINIDHPYNTYKYPGLPPGPIAMPDIEDIDAVLNHRKHNYLFFSADPRRPGYHNFAETFDRHLQNAMQYRKHLNSQKIWK